MHSLEPCLVIANPAAGGGRTARLLGDLREQVRATFGPNTTLSCTERPLQAGELARDALRRGARHLVIVGGDGTIHEVVNGVYSQAAELAAQASFSIVSTGTGRGLAQSLGLPLELAAQLAIAGGSTTRLIDLGLVKLDRPDRSEWFVSECQVGLGAEVVRKSSRSKKAFAGSLTYALTTLPLLFSHPNADVALRTGDSEWRRMPITGVAIGNGAITAGGMRLTPRAVLDDGLIDVLIIKGQSAMRRLRDMSKVSSGKHIFSPGCEYLQARRVAMIASGEVAVSADGELVGTLPAQFESCPGVFRVHCPATRHGKN